MTPFSYEQVVSRLYKYCGYQERCIREVRQKLAEWGVLEKEHDELINKLVEENFINEERFARSYVRGKFKSNKWGTQKIVNGLKQKGIDAEIIREALNEIQGEAYSEMLTGLIRAKLRTMKETDPHKKKYKLANYAVAKGFSPSDVWKVINSEINSAE